MPRTMLKTKTKIKVAVPRPHRCCICKQTEGTLIEWVTAKPKPLRERPLIHPECYDKWEGGMLRTFGAMHKHMEAKGLLENSSVIS